jgi:hypothetical protein
VLGGTGASSARSDGAGGSGAPQDGRVSDQVEETRRVGWIVAVGAPAFQAFRQTVENVRPAERPRPGTPPIGWTGGGAQARLPFPDAPPASPAGPWDSASATARNSESWVNGFCTNAMSRWRALSWTITSSVWPDM